MNLDPWQGLTAVTTADLDWSSGSFTVEMKVCGSRGYVDIYPVLGTGEEARQQAIAFEMIGPAGQPRLQGEFTRG